MLISLDAMLQNVKEEVYIQALLKIWGARQLLDVVEPSHNLHRYRHGHPQRTGGERTDDLGRLRFWYLTASCQRGRFIK
jgi:hypothetical protein